MATNSEMELRGKVTEDTMELAGTIEVSQLYKCNYCNDDFTSETERYAHQVDMHWKDMISQCEICVKNFLLKKDPDSTHQCHLRKPSEPSPVQKEKDVCSGASNNRASRKVRKKRRAVAASGKKPPKWSQPVIFPCKECSRVCMSILDMLNHRQSHHTSTTQCHHCHLSCRNEQSLVEHLKLHINQEWHFCRTCSVGFDREAALLDHEKSEHGWCETKHDTRGIPEDQQVEVKVHLEPDSWMDESEGSNDSTQTKMYSCRYCLKKFSHQVDYQQHVDSFHPKKYDCEICGRAFVRRCEVRLHMKHHCEDRNFVCQYCAKSFKRQTHLDCHILSHTGEKKFQCKECGKAFKAKRTLIGHEMKHLGEQPFQCKDCGVKFTLKSSLLKHEEGHSTSRVRVRCPKCDKDFSSKESLVIHDKAIHLKIKQFVCETCGTAFAYQSHLKKHQMIHRNEKPFKCNFCDKAFRLAYSRMLHESEHTGRKPHKCPLCAKQYATKARLDRHRKTHTKPVVLTQQEPAGMQVQHLLPVTECNPHLTSDMGKHYHHKNPQQTSNTLVIEERSVSSTLLTCNICGNEFTSYCDWMAHQQTHSITQLENHINVTQGMGRFHSADTVSVMLSFMSSAS